jgi:formate--tetrahydrofolate ligase
VEEPLTGKLEAVARRVYGADGVVLASRAEQRLRRFERAGLRDLPICMAKTQYSLSDDASLLNAPTGFQISVRDARAYTGAGWVVALCGEVMQMPGLGPKPAAREVDLASDGRIVGLF